MTNLFHSAAAVCLSIVLIIFGIFLGAGHFLQPAMASQAYIAASIIAIVGGIACLYKNYKWARGDL